METKGGGVSIGDGSAVEGRAGGGGVAARALFPGEEEPVALSDWTSTRVLFEGRDEEGGASSEDVSGVVSPRDGVFRATFVMLWAPSDPQLAKAEGRRFSFEPR